MRDIQIEAESVDDMHAAFGETGGAAVDWKEAPEAVLEKVNCLLEAHGLEVVTVNTGGSDTIFFGILPREV